MFKIHRPDFAQRRYIAFLISQPLDLARAIASANCALKPGSGQMTVFDLDLHIAVLTFYLNLFLETVTSEVSNLLPTNI